MKFVKGEGALPTRKKDHKPQNLKKMIDQRNKDQTLKKLNELVIEWQNQNESN